MEQKEFIPKEKMSKKEKRKLDEERRVTWGFNPFNRIVPNKKAYDRNKAKEETRNADVE